MLKSILSEVHSCINNVTMYQCLYRNNMIAFLKIKSLCNPLMRQPSGLVSENFSRIMYIARNLIPRPYWNKALMTMMMMMMPPRMMTMSTVMMRIQSHAWVVYSFFNLLDSLPNCCYNKWSQTWWVFFLFTLYFLCRFSIGFLVLCYWFIKADFNIFTSFTFNYRLQILFLSLKKCDSAQPQTN